ncbi:hydrophobin 3 [Sporisorium reilianum f. sp. reilianum]|uniref:Hydrophobin 3 n=1 Tax=Sporisorium reilianum f. sp. reilianum TaxID=72559 RepID=A0A2N8UJ60_9BASI|nr:hydrophobin 3 [Sporisorium reilianum f. sp. reilianum]
MKYLQFLAAVAAVSAFSGPVLAGSVVDNTNQVAPVQLTGALLSQVANGQHAERAVKVDNSAQFFPIEGTAAALSAVLNQQKATKRWEKEGKVVDNTNQVLPIQATLAALSQVLNSQKAERSVDVHNSAQFLPIEATLAALSQVANGQHATKRGEAVINDNQVAPVEAVAAALSQVVSGQKTRRGETKEIHHVNQVAPAQATLTALSDIVNSAHSRRAMDVKQYETLQYAIDALQQALDKTNTGDATHHVDALTGSAEHITPKRDSGIDPATFLGSAASGISVPVGNKDLLKSLVKRYAEEEDAAMAKRTPSPHGHGQRPRPRGASEHNNNGQCSVGKAQCCNQVIHDESKKKTLAGLLGFNNLAGSIGLNCQQIPVLGVSLQSVCKSTPVCCTNVVQDGLVNIGCTSIPIN